MTDFLFARPSIVEGIGRNLDFFGSMNNYNYSANGEMADKVAMLSDMLAIYTDLYKAYIDTICQLEARRTGVR
jgi:hypothetical protein